MHDLEPHLAEMFRDEADERLGAFVDIMLSVERGETEPGDINSLFRHAHTLKGTASMLGLDEIEAVAHSLEDMLASVRDAVTLPPELVDPVLQVVDQLRAMIIGAAHAPVTPTIMHSEPPAAVAEIAPPAPVAPAASVPSTTAASAATQRERSIRVPAAKIDHMLDLVGETILHRRRLENTLEDAASDTEDAVEELGAGALLLEKLKDAALLMRTLPLASITGTLPRAVRDIAADCGKEVNFVVSGAETQLDRVILEGLNEPLVHLLRNAVAHGIETPSERLAARKSAIGTLTLHAQQRGGTIEITVSDDGRGISPRVMAAATDGRTLIDVLTQPGFSTADQVTELAGRGVGMDAVRDHVEQFRGSIDVYTDPGRGTRFVLQLPLALALLDVLLVQRGAHTFCIPLTNVVKVAEVSQVRVLEGRETIDVDGAPTLLADLADVLGADAPALGERPPCVVTSMHGRQVAIVVDEVRGEQEVLVKDLGLLSSLASYHGAAILGDGGIALILDPSTLLSTPVSTARRVARAATPDGPAQLPKVLVVEDSFTVREMQRSILETGGYRVTTARDGREALERLGSEHGVSLVLTDVDMPEMNGFELAEAIRADPVHGTLPIIMLTSRVAAEDSRRGVEIGVDAYMTKDSFNQQALLETLARLVGQ